MKELEAIMQKSDVLKLCLEAALRLSGEEDAGKACEQIHKTYKSRYSVVTAGREGSYLMYDGEVWHIPALGGQGVDSTGAGGAYYGGLSYALLTGIKGESAGYFAAACAAFACSRVGSLHLGTREEIDTILSGEGVEEAAETDIPDVI
jgi:sugar/nucleoside kinase (ribokinase family)